MTMSTPKQRPTARFAKLYAGTWLALASLSIAYLVTLAVQPSLLGDGIGVNASRDAGESQNAIARFATDLTGLKQTVSDIKSDVASLRTAVETSAAREKEVADRLAAVEARAKAPILAADVVPAAAPKTAAQRQAEARAKKAAEKAIAPAAATATPTGETAALAPAVAGTNVTVLNAAPVATPVAVPTSPLATGSIAPATPPAQGVPAPPPSAVQPAAAAPSFGPGSIKVTTPPQPAGLELSSGPSLDALRLNWSLLSDQNGALKNLEPRYTNAGEGQPYQLVAGPIGTPEEAARVCAQLKAKRVACRVTGFNGNAL